MASRKPSEKPVIMPTPDVSMFDDDDVANLVLQRSEVGHAEQEIRDWIAGDDKPLLTYARDNRDMILSEAYRIAEQECEVFAPAIDPIAPKRIADIGCGYAFVDLALFRRYGNEIVLIDIEEGTSRHFGFESTGAGYTNMDRARDFLEKNGVPRDMITTLNPKTDDIAAAGTFDVGISLLSCGFHYPVGTYEDLFRQQINAGGVIVLDIRKGSGGISAMKQIGAVDILARHQKHSMVVVWPAGSDQRLAAESEQERPASTPASK